MTFRKRIVKRVTATLGAATLAAVPLAAVTSTAASASTIPYGNVQICAQGNYPASVHVLGSYNPTGLSRPDVYSWVVFPGGPCWMATVDTWGQWAQVDVVGRHDDGSEFYIGSRWYNSSVSGIGLGAEGSQWDPYIWQW